MTLLLVLNLTGLLESRYRNFGSNFFLFVLDMAVRLNPCEFDKSDVDQFLKLRDEYRGKLEDIANAKINRNRFFSSKMSGLKPHKKNSNNDAYKYHQHEESEDPNDEFSDDDIISMINVKKKALCVFSFGPLVMKLLLYINRNFI